MKETGNKAIPQIHNVVCCVLMWSVAFKEHIDQRMFYTVAPVSEEIQVKYFAQWGTPFPCSLLPLEELWRWASVRPKG